MTIPLMISREIFTCGGNESKYTVARTVVVSTTGEG